MKKKKLFRKILSGSKNIRFSEIAKCAEAFGFHLNRVKGSHHIYVHPDIPELVNLQDVGGKDLDIDLHIESIENPLKYPFVYK